MAQKVMFYLFSSSCLPDLPSHYPQALSAFLGHPVFWASPSRVAANEGYFLSYSPSTRTYAILCSTSLRRQYLHEVCGIFTHRRFFTFIHTFHHLFISYKYITCVFVHESFYTKNTINWCLIMIKYLSLTVLELGSLRWRCQCLQIQILVRSFFMVHM